MTVNPVPRTYLPVRRQTDVRGFGACPRPGRRARPFGEVQNIHPVRLWSVLGLRTYGVHSRLSRASGSSDTHMRGVLWYGVYRRQGSRDLTAPFSHLTALACHFNHLLLTHAFSLGFVTLDGKRRRQTMQNPALQFPMLWMVLTLLGGG